MRLGLHVGTMLVAIFWSATAATAGNIPRAPVDRLWNEHMLKGTSADYANGRPLGRLTYNPRFEQAKGSWVLAVYRSQGIRLSDYSGTRLFGLLRGGGWDLQGGLLDQAAEDDGAVELYVKKVLPVYPGLFDHSAPKREQSYEFFLLYRQKDAAQARVLHEWIVRPEQVHWYVPDYLLTGPLRIDDEAILRGSETSDVRGVLAYDPATKIATITITGLKHPFEERVDLSSTRGN